MQKFEGQRQASEEAEMASKRTKASRYVIKSLEGGLHYRVVDKVDNLKAGEKVVNHWKEGNIQK